MVKAKLKLQELADQYKLSSATASSRAAFHLGAGLSR